MDGADGGSDTLLNRGGGTENWSGRAIPAPQDARQQHKQHTQQGRERPLHAGTAPPCANAHAAWLLCWCRAALPPRTQVRASGKAHGVQHDAVLGMHAVLGLVEND